MDRSMGVATESSGEAREFIKWTEDMDARLFNPMLDESLLGNNIESS